MKRITRAGVVGRVKRLRLAVGVRIAGTRPRRPGTGTRTSLESWLVRQRGRRSGAFPDEWRVHPALPFARPSRVAVVLHVYYRELLDELLAQLAVIPVGYDLLVTNSTGKPLSLDGSIPRGMRNSVVLDVPNRGRDILPMVCVVNAGILDPYDLVLKVHTKRSAWRDSRADLQGSGDEWKQSFLRALLDSRENVTEILDSFAGDPDLGLVTADGSLHGPEHWGGDEVAVLDLLERIGLTVEHDALRFPGGSIYWVRGFVLQALRSLALTADDFEPEEGQIDGTTAHAVERLVGVLSTEAGLRMEPRGAIRGGGGGVARYAVDSVAPRRIRAVPFYLPQFHPTLENDRWWGTGFTEWQNVTAAHPVYVGHEQPLLPTDLGFYDLRLDAVRDAQQALAERFGVEGFMYYYYWFAGRRLLSMPIEKLAAGDTQKTFCLMWANENWTRRWDGRESDLLIGQDYEVVPATRFIDDIVDFLRDPRYLTVDGRKVVSIYRISQIPNYPAVIEHWRRRAREAGVGELLLVSVDVARDFDGLDRSVAQAGLDARHWFPPHNSKWDWIDYGQLGADPEFTGNLLSYGALVRDMEGRLQKLPSDTYPAVMVNFDNTARRQWTADIWHGSNPYTFRRWLSATARAVADRAPEHRLVFVNAWNEWAEGAVLEPTVRHGLGYLCAVRDVVRG